MIPVERQQRILQLLAERGVVSIVELTDWLQVSHMTIRRDIQKLEEQGRVLSVSGGVSLSQRIKSEPSHAAKRSLMQGAKLAIARLAAAQVSEGSTVYLDAGTTSLELARELALREDLMIVTNDFMVCAYLIEHGRCRLYHTGGQVIRENQSCAGEATAHFLRNLHLDIAFLSASSWDSQGISTPSEQKVPVKRAVVESAATRILICDSSKYGKVGTFNVVSWDAIDQVITDEQLPQSAREALAQHGVRVTMAPLASLVASAEQR
ncbi:DeoR/GlpR family DNA-binding transcription regulator [Aeromonas caviae]|uniref:DeoR/GlpR family DNA-binding transcription regulator n=1 Tax=Aeromonas caviae TaxID=648 RepID=UPI00124943C3|nr:DeoR/GlpR family DNA-binding transcription regulator [Aeromonas caviae]KAB0676611.1 DeoR/GlpR transcriptional regulator [Aeromonas caviae]MBL0606657.1 DeoR/GlpR transcriptional regulator [Aeromonas caviae]MBS4707274.1 DeoR/GlpR transcriptional regulator [Aeromonas caviae]MDX7700261.1 DeoR/GlpR family DNA-binding transcription regulator [Aeromonas caviae]MDX7763651.1 DeoR/GlpR family DNA-binding transcription regulator [Aeromonas caviae]